MGNMRRWQACKGEKSLFCTYQGWLERHLAGKQPVKVGGVCRVIGTSTQGSRRKEPHISGNKSRNQLHFPTRIKEETTVHSFHLSHKRYFSPELLVVRSGCYSRTAE